MRLSQLIAKARREKNLSHDEAAKLIGVHRVTFNRWCTGERAPAPTHWKAISQVLDLPADTLQAKYFEILRKRG